MHQYDVIQELPLIVGSAGLLDPTFHRRVGLKGTAIEGEPASEINSVFFLEHIHGIVEVQLCWKGAVCLGAGGEGLLPKAPAKGF